MIERNTNIKSQYNAPGLFEEILKRLGGQHRNLGTISRTDISGVDEFHVRGAQVSRELTEDVNLNGLKVLDVGCGLGGPARMLAAEHNCYVTGIDMSSDYIDTAKKLSGMVGLGEKTSFHQGDALALPFADGSFDVAWTQHVQMNVEDKAKFYSEIYRVLGSGGKLIYYDIFKKGEQDVTYPVPWANTADVSFLGTTTNMENILENLGFDKMKSTDQTKEAREFLNALFEKIRVEGPPSLGLNVLMGTATKEKLGNIRNGIVNKVLALQSGVHIK